MFIVFLQLPLRFSFSILATKQSQKLADAKAVQEFRHHCLKLSLWFRNVLGGASVCLTFSKTMIVPPCCKHTLVSYYYII